MPRPSSKESLIQAALEIITESGVQALTYESLSTRTGKSRSGLLYHFPSKEEMVQQAHDYAVAKWNEEAEKYLPGAFEEATPLERAHAYILATVREQVEWIEGGYTYRVHDTFDEAVWREIRDRWVDFTEGALTADHHMALLAADGMWMDLGPQPRMTEAMRQEAVEQMLAITRPPSVEGS